MMSSEAGAYDVQPLTRMTLGNLIEVNGMLGRISVR